MNKKKQKALFAFLIILFLSLFLLYDYVYVPFLEKAQQVHDEIEMKAWMLNKYLAIQDGIGELKTNYDELKKTRKKTNSKMLKGKTSSLAGAELKNIIKDIIKAKDGAITSERINNAEERGGIKVVSVRLDAELKSPSTLHEILYEMANRTPTIVVDNLEIRVRNVRQPGPVRLQLQVSALAR
jgi:hypothetical protein